MGYGGFGNLSDSDVGLVELGVVGVGLARKGLRCNGDVCGRNCYGGSGGDRDGWGGFWFG